MEDRGVLRIDSGTDVYDQDSHKVGTVAHVHELDATGPPGSRGYLEVATGFLGRIGLGRNLFVPLEAVREVTEGGVFLDAGKAELDQPEWHTRPAALAGGASAASEVAAPAGAGAAVTPQAVDALEDWATAAPHYRRRWEEQLGSTGGRWETYEPAYRFAWEMARLPGYAGQPWPRVRSELQARWEVQHAEVEWETVADAVRDAWEHVAGAAGTAGAAGGAPAAP
jgi:hypothetical protein